MACRLRVVRTTFALIVDAGPWLLAEGEELEGHLLTHPVNASRKVILRTDHGTFNINREDVIVAEVEYERSSGG